MSLGAALAGEAGFSTPQTAGQRAQIFATGAFPSSVGHMTAGFLQRERAYPRGKPPSFGNIISDVTSRHLFRSGIKH